MRFITSAEPFTAVKMPVQICLKLVLVHCRGNGDTRRGSRRPECVGCRGRNSLVVVRYRRNGRD